MKISIASSESPWSLPDELCPDIYFTPGYGLAAASTRNGEWQCVHWDGDIMVPYVVTDVVGEYRDAASPYGYSGIHIASGCTAGDLAEFWQAARDHWRSLGLVAMFFRLSPLDEPSARRFATLDGVRLTRRGDTVTVPTGAGPDAVWSAMEGRSRTAVRKARRLGMVASLRPVAAEDLVPSAPFRRLYESTMKRVGSGSGYLFPDSYYETLRAGLGAGLMVAEVRGSCGDTVAAALVLAHADRAHYHLAGSDPAGARDGANNLLLWTILEWAAESGRSAVHLGGGIGAEDSLFQFKRSFGGIRTPFQTGALVIDPSAYGLLTERRAEELALTPTDLIARDYFPAYRCGSQLV